MCGAVDKPGTIRGYPKLKIVILALTSIDWERIWDMCT